MEIVTRRCYTLQVLEDTLTAIELDSEGYRNIKLYGCTIVVYKTIDRAMGYWGCGAISL